MVYVLILVFMAVFFISLVGYVFMFGERLVLARRVDQVVGAPTMTVRERELSVPLATRVFKPLLTKAGSFMVRALPSEKETELGKKITMAGFAGRLSPVDLMVFKYLGAIFLGLGALVAAGTLQWPLVNSVAFAAVALPLGLMLPEYLLKSRAGKRNADVEEQLPHILDLLTVSVEAGLGFDGAMYKVIEKTKGTLVAEMKQMMQEIKVGKPRRDALKDLGNRFDVNDLNNFISAVILGEQLGISIGNVLRRQADQIRTRRRQSAEEKAMKAPIKLLFPLIFLIFPALFLIILGPGAIQIFNLMLK